MSVESPCSACHSTGYLRPDIVWFGEMPYQMERIHAAIERWGIFVSIGTGGTVYPAAGFVEDARRAGADTIELNLEPPEGRSLFAEARLGRATELVPVFVEDLLRRH